MTFLSSRAVNNESQLKAHGIANRAAQFINYGNTYLSQLSKYYEMFYLIIKKLTHLIAAARYNTFQVEGLPAEVGKRVYIENRSTCRYIGHTILIFAASYVAHAMSNFK